MSGPAAAVAPPPEPTVEERVLANQGLVYRVAKMYRGRGVEIDDLAQLGNIGLMRAAAKFDPARGVKFGTYATYWIRREIGQWIECASWPVHVPRDARRQAHRHMKAWRSLAEGRHATTTDEDAFDATGVPAHLRPRIRLAARALRADRVDGEAGAEMLRLHPGAPDSAVAAIEAAEERGRLAPALDALDAEERTLLGLLYGLDGEPALPTLAVARRLGVAWKTVARKHAAALAALRGMFEAPTAHGDDRR